MNVELVAAIVCLCLGQPAPSDPPKPSDVAKEGVAARVARAQLQLAEANLERVRQINRRLARTVSASVVAEYEQDVAVATLQLEQAQLSGGDQEFPVWLLRAEAAWKAADSLWKNGTAVNRRSPGTFEALDIERFRLRAQVLRLQLEQGQSLAQAPREAQLQWEMNLMNLELQRIKEETSRVAPFSRYYPMWR